MSDKLAAALRANTLLADENARLKRSAPLRPSAVEAVEAAAKAAAPTQAPAPARRTHVVADGDTLTKISLQFYGTANRWQEIYNANRDVLASPSLLSVGSTLTIP